jgi:Berberine and berberine like
MIANAMGELRKVGPDPAAYVSESNFFQNDWQRSYWGTNYERLRAIKRQCDPDDLFFVHHGVGSEDWSDDGFERTCCELASRAHSAPLRTRVSGYRLRRHSPWSTPGQDGEIKRLII